MIRSFFCFAVAIITTTVSLADDALRARNDAIIVRALERMDGYDFSNDAHVREAIARHLAQNEGTAEYVTLARRFRPANMADKLASLMQSGVADSVKVDAANLLGETDNGPKLLRQMLKSESEAQATETARVLSLLGNGRAINILRDVASDAERPFAVRRHAVSGLAGNRNGEQVLLQLAETKQLAADTRLLAGGLLARSREASVREKAAELLPQPQQKNQQPLEPIDKLAQMRGDAEAGLKLFRGTATCANCHIVDGFGKEVGPNLSEIGNKLSREAMFTSILDPSAGISHNYEQYIVLTDSGQVINGLKMSETPLEVVIRTAEAIDRKIPRTEIEQIKKSETSIMPDNLHLNFDQKGLIDIIEYMTTLTNKPAQ
jgi:putative heme-binding domain-containing protein